MNVKELRIGNYVNFNDKLIEVNNIQDDSINLELNGMEQIESCLYIDDLKPIPLTEEILLKCGFDKGKYKDTFDDYTLNGYRLVKKDCIYEILVYGSSVILSTISYLHQLQNIYFYLTGKEI